MPQRHHRHSDHGIDVDDDGGPLTIVDTGSGTIAPGERSAIADAIDADDADLGPEEAALHIERFPDDEWPESAD